MTEPEAKQGVRDSLGPDRRKAAISITFLKTKQNFIIKIIAIF